MSAAYPTNLDAALELAKKTIQILLAENRELREEIKRLRREAVLKS